MAQILKVNQQVQVSFEVNETSGNAAANVQGLFSFNPTVLQLDGLACDEGAVDGGDPNNWIFGNLLPNTSRTITATFTILQKAVSLPVTLTLSTDTTDSDLDDNVKQKDILQVLNGTFLPDGCTCNDIVKSTAADIVRTGINTAASIVPELSEVVVEAGKTYKIKFHGVGSSNDTGEGLNVQLIEEDGADGIWAGIGFGQNSTTELTDIVSNTIETNDLNRGIDSQSVDVVDQDVSIMIDASFICTTSGTLDIWFGSSFGVAEVTLKAGATLFVEEFQNS